MFKQPNNPLAADGWEISVERQRLLAAAEGERYAASAIGRDIL
ncbi:hypothetical protein [Fischerella sp.]|nr:hypothetical protein [Fischerella sp.]